MLGIPPLGTWAPLATWIVVSGCASPAAEADFTAGGTVVAADASARGGSTVERPDMDWVPSQHFRRGERTRETVDAIAIHTTEGSFDSKQSFARNQQRNYRGTVNYFKKNDRNVSAHFLIGPRGEITQMVREGDIAHTTTYYNARSFGIECAGWSSRKETWTPQLLSSLVELCAYLSVSWDIPLIHPAGTARQGAHRVRTSDPDRPRFDAAGIVGHNQVQPWNKTDPGRHFPWQRFMARVRERADDLRPRPMALRRPATDSGRREVMRVHDLGRLAARRRAWFRWPDSAGTAPRGI